MKSKGGFALVAALWLLIALSAVGLQSALTSRARRQAAANVLDEVRARSASIAGTEYARSRLTAAMLGRADEIRSEAMASSGGRRQRAVMGQSVSRLFRNTDPFLDPWRSPGELVVSEMAFGDARYALFLRDIGAALDLNDASEDMLRQFFSQGLGVDYAEADQLTQVILDWRDEDDLPRINGGEREEYLDAEALVFPPNRDFADLDELRHVLGMTPDLFRRAAPYLTLVGDSEINVNSAPEPVLSAIPGITPQGVEEILRLRESGNFPTNDEELAAAVADAARALASMGRSFSRRVRYSTNQVEILSEGWVDGGLVRVSSRVVVTRSNSGARVVWREVF